MGNGPRKRQSNLSRRSKRTVMVKPHCFSVMDGNRIKMSWKEPTVMKNRSRIQDGDARRIRSGWWMPPSDRPTVCPSVASRNLLLYQSLPISIPYRYALLRRRKDDTGVDTAARGIVE